MNKLQLLKFYQELGVDEIINEKATNYLTDFKPQETLNEIANNQQPKNNQNSFIDSNVANSNDAFKKLGQIFQANQSNLMTNSPAKAIKDAQKIADKCQDIKQLKQAVLDFNGCSLKKMATNTVFCDGNEQSQIMIIGEAPGNHEDLQGIPFCGDSGKLLDDMFLRIGLTRQENLYITNTLFWRPPGNRRPTNDELAICQPFVEKHIQLLKPKLIILMGSTAMFNILKTKDPISKVRGRFVDYHHEKLENPIKTMTLFHPSYLFRQGTKKKIVWQDLLKIQEFLNS